jgi:hypothetical protein
MGFKLPASKLIFTSARAITSTTFEETLIIICSLEHQSKAKKIKGCRFQFKSIYHARRNS